MAVGRKGVSRVFVELVDDTHTVPLACYGSDCHSALILTTIYLFAAY